jgi:enolase
MTATEIVSIHGRQILDSRGRPTVEAEVRLAGGARATASAPAGASRGAAEACELRDQDPAHYAGRGVRAAVANIDGEIAAALIGRDALDQTGTDRLMVELDGTSSLSRLGGNAILAVSIAVVRAGAIAIGAPLHLRLADLAGTAAPCMPTPMVNILSGGLHAGRGMDVQDFLAIPVGASTYGQALEWSCRVRDAAAHLCALRGLSTLMADEGGLGPGFAESREALELMTDAIEDAGLRPGEEVAIALDVASSSMVDAGGHYRFERAGRRLSAAEMTELLASWAHRYPIVSIEDGLHEEDWTNWPELTRRLKDIQLIGDDVFATQPARIRRGIAEGVANAVLIKINQNGTLSGTLEALAAARTGGYATVVSARSGETEDSFIADLAVGAAAGQIKIGSVRNGERLAKYNQLLRIEEDGLPFAQFRAPSASTEAAG